MCVYLSHYSHTNQYNNNKRDGKNKCLSTKTKTTNVSGRGIGLDVVETAVLRHGGQIEVHSAVGEFTEFKVFIPMQIFSRQLFILRAGKTRFALPSAEVVRIHSDLESLKNEKILMSASFFGEKQE